MNQQRVGLIVWINDAKSAKNLDRFGNIHYISKKLNYVVIYVEGEQVKDITSRMVKLPFVKKVEPSLRAEIPTEYNSSKPDKTRSYSI